MPFLAVSGYVFRLDRKHPVLRRRPASISRCNPGVADNKGSFAPTLIQAGNSRSGYAESGGRVRVSAAGDDGGERVNPAEAAVTGEAAEPATEN